MTDGARLILGMTATAMMFPLAIIMSSIPAYVPDARLAEIAHTNADPVSARAEMVEAMRYCARRRANCPRASIDTLGTSKRRFFSWQNNAGLFAVTHIDCPPQQACSVRGNALIPLPR
ncbi:hypothetical protein [Sphingomonas sp.]|uniref:hypothetical protein n=2 Tax=Sphingomonas TaxID=13687 RepID=UPI0035B4D779